MKSKINIKHMKEHISHLINNREIENKEKIYIKIKLNAHLKDEAQYQKSSSSSFSTKFKLFKLSKLFKLFKP